MLVNRIIRGVFALFAATALAADCSGDKGEHPEVGMLSTSLPRQV